MNLIDLTMMDYLLLGLEEAPFGRNLEIPGK